MAPSAKSIEITEAFIKYHSTGDSSLVKMYKKDEIKIALHEYHLDKLHQYYATMEKWVQSLEQQEEKLERQKEKTKERQRDNFWRGTALTVAILGVFIGAVKGCQYIQSEAKIKGVPDFLMKDNLACVIVHSTERAAIGGNMTLMDLNSAEPKAMFDSGGWSPMKNIFEDEELLVIQLIASITGSVDTILLNKETGIFVRTQAGAMVFEYAIADKGYCK